MNILRVRCRSAAEFQKLYGVEHPDGVLFCPTTTELPSDTPVVVEIACKDLPNKVLVRGTVMSWRPALPRLRIRAGAKVRFAPEEAPKRDFILHTLNSAGAAAGTDTGPAPTKRKHARIPVGLSVRLRVGNELESLPAELREISVNGGLLAAEVQPALGTDVVVEIITPGGVAPVLISGKVIYHSGKNQTGVKFLFREGGGSRRLRELVRRFKIS